MQSKRNRCVGNVGVQHKCLTKVTVYCAVEEKTDVLVMLVFNIITKVTVYCAVEEKQMCW